MKACSELRCIWSYLAFFHGLKVSVLGTQSPKYHYIGNIDRPNLWAVDTKPSNELLCLAHSFFTFQHSRVGSHTQCGQKLTIENLGSRWMKELNQSK